MPFNLKVQIPSVMLSAALVSFGADALGQDTEEDQWDGDYGATAEVRSDLILGLSAGAWVGSLHGYLNEASKLGKPEFREGTGLGIGGLGNAWIGVALADEFSFLLGGGYGQIQGADGSAAGGQALLRVEGYPLFSYGDDLQYVGVAGTFGLGSYNVKRDEQTVAEGGSLSIVGLGVFWEALRTGGLSVGPSLDYLHMYSQSLSSHSALLSARVAYYSGP